MSELPARLTQDYDPRASTGIVPESCRGRAGIEEYRHSHMSAFGAERCRCMAIGTGFGMGHTEWPIEPK